MSDSVICDEFGRPMLSPRKRWLESLDRGPLIPEWVKILQDVDKNISMGDWETLSSHGQRAYGSSGPIRALIDDKAGAAIADAFQAVYTGYATTWGRIMSSWLNETWANNCSPQGWPITLQSILFLISINVDHSGDCGLLFTEREEDGYPLFQLIPSHRIRRRGSSGKSIMPPGTKWAGLREEFGIIKSKSGVPIAWCLLGDTVDDDKIVESDSFLHIYDPQWIGQSRGWPIMFHGFRHAKTAQSLHEAEEANMINLSGESLMVFNDTGTIKKDGPDADDDDDGAVPGKVQMQTVIPGSTRAFRAGSGEKIEAFQHKRPGEDWESFIDRLIQMIATGSGWPSELVWRPRQMSGPLVRAIQGRARRTAADRQSLLKGPWMWMTQRAVAWGILHDVVPFDPPRDWLTAWRPTLPAQISIDDGRDAQNRRDDVRSGLKSMGTALGEIGVWDKDKHLNEIVDDAFSIEDKIREREAKRGWPIGSFDRRRVIMLSVNEQQEVAQTSEPEPPPKSKK